VDDRPSAQQQSRRPASPSGGFPLGTIFGIPVRVNASWLIIAAVIAVGFEPLVSDRLPGLGGRAYLVSGLFAVLLYVSVLLHELSHALVARRLGLPVRGITIHLLGGYTEMTEEAPNPAREVAVSGSGPALSLLVGGLSWLLAQPIDQPVPEFLLLELAFANVAVGVFNLLPALPLDGGHLLRSLVWRVTGDRHQGTIVAAWAGRVLAVLVVLMPWVISRGQPTIFGIVWAVLIAGFLWSGSSQALAVARLRQRLPGLDARRLARPAIPVPSGTSLAEAVRRAQAAGARALVVVGPDGRPRALVNEAAVAATPEERRPWVDVATVARSMETGLLLPAHLTGEDLVRAIQALPATEYLVVDPDGSPVGVLTTADVDAALAAA